MEDLKAGNSLQVSEESASHVHMLLESFKHHCS